MANDILSTSITDGWFVVALFVLLAVSLAGALIRPPRGRWSTRRWSSVVILTGITGAGFGWLVTWLVSDVFVVFGLALTPVVHAAVALGCAGIALGVLGLTRRGVWRRVCAALLIVTSIVAGAAVVNIDFGQYRTLRQALGLTTYHNSGLPALQANSGAKALADWRPPADLPKAGVIVQVQIPATVSQFAARPALVYLPPAALTADPPLLPVVIALSGQPGSPTDVFGAGHLNAVLDASAAADRGIAPIVVVPDQLGAPTQNPMCVDSPLGNSASYLTVDVPNWIRGSLNVLTDRTHWAIAGFSQGGTCAVQLGAGHPELFGSLLAVSPELVPTLGSEAETIAKGFGGSAAAYAAAQPLAVMAATAPYADSQAVFVVGENDPGFRPFSDELAAGAKQAGMVTSLLIAPGSGHDWHTGAYGLATGIAALSARLGIDGVGTG